VCEHALSRAHAIVELMGGALNPLKCSPNASSDQTTEVMKKTASTVAIAAILAMVVHQLPMSKATSGGDGSA